MLAFHPAFLLTMSSKQAGSKRSAELQAMLKDLIGTQASSTLSVHSTASSSVPVKHSSQDGKKTGSSNSSEDKKPGASNPGWKGKNFHEKASPASAKNEVFFKDHRAPIIFTSSPTPSEIQGRVASPPTGTTKQRPMSAISKTGRRSGEPLLGAEDCAHRGGGGMVRPVSAPPRREIQVIDRRRKKSFPIGKDPPDLDEVVHRMIEGERQELVGVGASRDRQRSAFGGEIGASLGSRAQAAARKRDTSPVQRRVELSTYLSDRRMSVSVSETVGRERERKEKERNHCGVFCTPSQSTLAVAVTRQELPQYKSNYHRVLEELSSPSPVRVRVTVKRPLVVCPAQTSVQEKVDRQKRPGSTPAKRYTLHTHIHVNHERTPLTTPWRWRVTQPVPIGHQKA